MIALHTWTLEMLSSTPSCAVEQGIPSCPTNTYFRFKSWWEHHENIKMSWTAGIKMSAGSISQVQFHLNYSQMLEQCSCSVKTCGTWWGKKMEKQTGPEEMENTEETAKWDSLENQQSKQSSIMQDLNRRRQPHYKWLEKGTEDQRKGKRGLPILFNLLRS